MTDLAQGWGPPRACDAVDPVGEPCVLIEGHVGNHMTAAHVQASEPVWVDRRFSGRQSVAVGVIAVLGLGVLGAVALWAYLPASCALTAWIAYRGGGNPWVWSTAGFVLGPLGVPWALWDFRA